MSRRSLLALLALASVGAGACLDLTNSDASVANVRVLLTDAPSDFIASATVDIGEVSLVPADDGERVVISEDGTDGFVNLLDLQGSATTLLGDAEIEAGDYSQIRMIVEAARVVLAEGYTFRDGSSETDLTVPSGAQSGLKLHLRGEDGEPATIAPGETVLVLDFDVHQSFVLRGNPETPAGVHGVNFKPSIRVTAMDVAASISGTVSTALEGVSVEGLVVSATPTDEGAVDEFQTLVGTAVTDESGAYTIYFLAPGAYEVAVAVGDGLTTNPTSSAVSLGAQESADGVDFAVVAGG